MPDGQSPPEDALARLLDIVRRRLHAASVRLLPAGDVPLGVDSSLRRRLPDGRWLVVDLGEGAAREDVGARLDIVLACFSVTLSSLADPPHRAAVPDALHAELEALVEASVAVDALLVDGDTDIVWCSALGGPAMNAEGRPRTVEARHVLPPSRPPRLVLLRPGQYPPPVRVPGPARVPASSPESLPEISRRALEAVRAMPEISTLHRGGRVHRVHHEEDLCFVARTVADLYVLLAVFDGPFDELRAERAFGRALPAVEMLIVALPPLEPPPGLRGAAAARARRPR